MEIIAKSKYVRQSPRKLRLVADQIRGLKVEEALILLENLNKKGAEPILAVLKQAVANAVNNFELKKEALKIESLEVGKGPMYKRMDKSHRSFRWGTIQKRTAHIRLVLEGEKEATKVKKTEKVKKEKKIKKKKKIKEEKKGKKDGSKS